jgi:hypothetical protein
MRERPQRPTGRGHPRSRTGTAWHERWGALLESVLGATPQGFESLILRHYDQAQRNRALFASGSGVTSSLIRSHSLSRACSAEGSAASQRSPLTCRVLNVHHNLDRTHDDQSPSPRSWSISDVTRHGSPCRRSCCCPARRDAGRRRAERDGCACRSGARAAWRRPQRYGLGP